MNPLFLSSEFMSVLLQLTVMGFNSGLISFFITGEFEFLCFFLGGLICRFMVFSANVTYSLFNFILFLKKNYNTFYGELLIT